GRAQHPAPPPERGRGAVAAEGVQLDVPGPAERCHADTVASLRRRPRPGSGASMTENDGTYLAEPPRSASAGVLVVHDWCGLLPHVRAASDELAAAGLVALAPDLYGGRIAADPAQAEGLGGGMGQAAAPARLDEAVATLRNRVGGGPVGVLGWSLGGMFALLQATTGNRDAGAGSYARL